MASPVNRLFLLELNEFNVGLLRQAAGELELENIGRAMQMAESRLKTDDTYDSNFLEPWVQWVSVHTGVPSSTHKIKHLGDVPALDQPQIWEALSDLGVTTGVWGAMNASRNGSKNCLFFLPDVWTFSEPGYPAELDRMLELPRYLSRNYLNLSAKSIFRMLRGLLSPMLKEGTVWILLRELPRLLFDIVRFRGKHFVFISFAEFLLTDLFLRYRKKASPQFSLLFLNSLAHLQHHHWHSKEDIRKNREIVHGLGYIDRLLGRIFSELEKGEVLLFMTALSQKNTNEERPWILYRAYDHGELLRELGVQFTRIQPHMTHDAHVFFETAEACQAAIAILRSVTVAGAPMFLLEDYPDEPTKLFYRIDFTDELPKSAILECGTAKLPFFEWFENIVVRTGKHVPVGSAFSDAPSLEKFIYNHEIFRFIVDFFRLGSESEQKK